MNCLWDPWRIQKLLIPERNTRIWPLGQKTTKLGNLGNVMSAKNQTNRKRSENVSSANYGSICNANLVNHPNTTENTIVRNVLKLNN